MSNDETMRTVLEKMVSTPDEDEQDAPDQVPEDDRVGRAIVEVQRPKPAQPGQDGFVPDADTATRFARLAAALAAPLEGAEGMDDDLD